MKIQKVQTGALQRVQKPSDRLDSEESKLAAGGAHRDRVEVSLKEELSALTASTMERPVDDLSLQELKDAIRSGAYQPDLQGLSDRLLAQPSLLDDLLDD